MKRLFRTTLNQRYLFRKQRGTWSWLLCFFLGVAFFHVDVNRSFASVGESKDRGSCQSAVRGTWTDAERWAWGKICEGEIADFSERSVGKNDGSRNTHLQEISAQFLKDIIGRKPRSSEYRGSRIWISNAIVRQPLDITLQLIDTSLVFYNMQFMSPVEVDGTSIRGSLIFKNCKFPFLRLREADIRGSLKISNSIFQVVDLSGARLGSSLMLVANKNPMSAFLLSGAYIGGSFQVSGASKFRVIHASGAHVSGQLNMRNSVFGEGFVADTLYVGHSAFFENSTIPLFNLAFSTVGINLDLRGSTLQYVNLTGADVGRELRLHSENYGVEWLAPSYFIVRNASVVELQDSKKSWPTCFDESSREVAEGLRIRKDALEKYDGIDAIQKNDKAYSEWLRDPHGYCTDLVGFNYRFFGGMDFQGGVVDREASWYLRWLETSRSFSPHSYHQLASVLNKMGYRDKAIDVRYHERDITRRAAWQKGSYGSWLWLSLLKFGIGYGLGSKTFRIVLWFIAFLLVGWLIAWSIRNKEPEFSDIGFWYSFDLLIPFARLDDRHYAVEHKGVTRAYFLFHQATGYLILTLLVAVVSSLVQ